MLRMLASLTVLLAGISQIAGGCVDKSSYCKIYRHDTDYYCRDHWLKTNCQKLCGYCTATETTAPPTARPCIDRIDCSFLSHYCSNRRYKTWMIERCSKTCGFCSGTATKAPVVTSDPNCQDVARSYTCDNYKRTGKCSEWKSWMGKYCKKSCNLCGTAPATTPKVVPTTSAIFPTSDLMTSAPQGKCGIPAVTGRVIAGEQSQEGQWPWQIAMLKYGRFSCGGSLIHPEWVLTASHCVTGQTASRLTIIVGEHDRTRRSGHEQKVNVKNIFMHPSYSRTQRNDIALLKLSQPVQLNKYVSTVCLPKQGEQVPIGKGCVISGWGKTTHPGSAVNTLRHTKIKVIDKATCQKLNNKYIPVTDDMVCASNRPSLQSGCHGDSGGPFVCQEQNGSWTIQGAVSWGSPRCDVFDANTVFTRVSSYRNWIDQIMARY